ncbi:MAG: NADH-quinone oxidoreductase subunit C [Candidatus Omnitrophica bacterium]|nr:NADH-quinone oxidoreductase subunit C [Candidatus Omnitrophota bacterium]
MSALTCAQQIQEKFGDLVSAPSEFREEIAVRVNDARRIAEVCVFAKHTLGFDFLVDITSVDNYGSEPRFMVVYELYGYGHHCRLRLQTMVSDPPAELPSVTPVWQAANWPEREIFDMMGLRFHGHPDPRRILMWEGCPFFPLRKDFPLAGKASEVPGVAFTQPAPVEGGPFVSVAGGKNTIEREPRSRTPH